MLLIGGNARHAGKTTLACSVSARYAALYPIIGLKVTAVKPSTEDFHGDHSSETDRPFSVVEETDAVGDKDTSRLLRAGARKVYYIRAGKDNVQQAVTDFLQTIGKDRLIICESRSIRDFIVPGVFCLMIRNSKGVQSKEMSSYTGLADVVSDSGNDPGIISELTGLIGLNGNHWILLNKGLKKE